MNNETTVFPASRGPDQVISGAGGISSDEAFGNFTVWRTYSFAPLWFEDALAESRRIGDPNARRREIIFSVAVVESYLLEWVRDEVLHRDFNKLDQYFPPGERRSISEKWKEIPKKLRDEGLINGLPDLSGSTWQQFLSLVKFRNGLIHAQSSRPETSSLHESQMPLPSIDQLQSLDAGWPVQVIIKLIEELNSAAATQLPKWLHS